MVRKKVVIVFAIAVIGALGIYGKSRSGSAHQSSGSVSPSSVRSETTMMPADPGNSTPTYKDGTYVGDSQDTTYGTVQIAVVVSGGQISDVKFLKMPDDLGHTQEVTAFAEPLLKYQTLQAQSAHIDFVSGATQTSEGYEQSLQSALNQANMG